MRRSSTSGPRSAQRAPGSCSYGIPTLPPFTQRIPPTTRSICECVWPARTTSASTPSRIAASRSSGVTSVTISVSLAGVPWQRSTRPSPSISTSAVGRQRGDPLELRVAEPVGAPGRVLAFARDHHPLAVPVDLDQAVVEPGEQVEALAPGTVPRPCRRRRGRGRRPATSGSASTASSAGRFPWTSKRAATRTQPMMTPSDLPRRALVVGLARSGRAAALALAARGVEVVATDRDEELDAGRLRAAGVEVRLGADDPALLDGVDLLVKSPGVPAEAPLVAAARERAVPVWSEVELAYRFLPGNPVLGVTGTNGKTTTTELLGAIFRAAGRPVEVAGNVGRPLSAVADPDPEAWVVAELSSFQLEDIEAFRATVGVLLNVTPDHLDRHGSLDGLHGRQAPALREPDGRGRRRRPARVPGRAGCRAPRRVRARRRAPRRAAPAGDAQPRERRRRDRRRARRGHSRRGDRRGPPHVRRRSAPARAGRRGRRRPLRERLEGDEPRGGRARADRLRPDPAHPRRLPQGRVVRLPRPRRPRARRAARVSDRRVRAGDRGRARPRERPVRR